MNADLVTVLSQSVGTLIPARRTPAFAVVGAATIPLALLALSMIGLSDAPIEMTVASEPTTAATNQQYESTRRQIVALRPRHKWIAIDTFGGRLRVHDGAEVLREAACSTGSGVSLRDPRTQKIWTFQTPIGERSVNLKVRNPVWTKPDWAFVEEGFEPPPLGHRDRRDNFSLGAYALHLGDGYMIHGTVFQTLVGRRLTHGCIRLRDEDLEYVYKTTPLGARVILY